MTRQIIICEFVAFCLFVSSLGQIRGNKCPAVIPMTDFDLTQLAGRWYVAKSFFSRHQEIGKCETFDFFVGSNGMATATHGEFSEMSNTTLTSSFSIRTLRKYEPGRLRANFWAGDEKFDLLVVDTDYTSYATLHICVKFEGGNRQYTYIMTRDPNFDRSYPFAPELNLMVTGIDRTYHKLSDRERCTYASLSNE